MSPCDGRLPLADGYRTLARGKTIGTRGGCGKEVTRVIYSTDKKAREIIPDNKSDGEGKVEEVGSGRQAA